MKHRYRIVAEGVLYLLQYSDNGTLWITLFKSSKADCERAKERYESQLP